MIVRWRLRYAGEYHSRRQRDSGARSWRAIRERATNLLDYRIDLHAIPCFPPLITGRLAGPSSLRWSPPMTGIRSGSEQQKPRTLPAASLHCWPTPPPPPWRRSPLPSNLGRFRQPSIVLEERRRSRGRAVVALGAARGPSRWRSRGCLVRHDAGPSLSPPPPPHRGAGRDHVRRRRCAGRRRRGRRGRGHRRTGSRGGRCLRGFAVS